MATGSMRKNSSIMMTRRQSLLLGASSLLALGGFSLSSQNTSQAAEKNALILAGRVLDTEGKPMRQNAAGHAILSPGDLVYVNDEITTDSDSRLQIQFEDDSLFNLSDRGKISIDSFLFQPVKHTGELKLQTLKGAFRFLSGKIAQRTPENISFKTPVGTIGIRGTHFMAIVNEDQTNCITLLPQPANDPKQTAIIVSSAVGSVTVDKPYFAADLLSRDQFPTLPQQDPMAAIKSNL